MRSRIFGFALLGLAAAFATFEVWVHTRADGPPVDDSDLASRWQPVPDAENGRAQLAAAAKALAWPEDRARRLRELRAAGDWDHALAQELLAPNRTVLAAFDASLEAPVYRPAKLEPANPSASELGAMTAESISLIYVDELCTVHALDTGFSGAGDAAIERSLRCFRSGLRRASMEGARLSDALSAVGTQNAALHAMRQILARARPTAAQSRAWAAEIETLRIPSEAWRNVWAEDYRHTSEPIVAGVSAEARGRRFGWLLPPTYSVHPNRARAMLAAEARALRAVAGATCAEANVGARPRPIADTLARLTGVLDVRLAIETQMLTPNGVGEFMVELSIGTWRKCDAMRCFGSTLPGVAQALIALRAYQGAHGELPATLAELVPAYLPHVPADGYDGAPLRYSREKKRLWSVGEDLRDDGGDAPGDAKGRPAEPKWEIPL